jgi:hypothetical protein
VGKTKGTATIANAGSEKKSEESLFVSGVWALVCSVINNSITLAFWNLLYCQCKLLNRLNFIICVDN